MSFEGRAFYNFLRMDGAEEYLAEAKEWQTADYRSWTEEALFGALKQEGVHLDAGSFALYVEQCDSPEEIAEVVLGDQEDEDTMERGYLLIFELWRRLCKDKQSLSVFCDELDHQMQLYTQGEHNEEMLQEMLTQLENILDQNTDKGEDPRVIFELVTRFLAHDLEDFIYDFAAEQLDGGNEVYASELVDGFYDYIETPFWLDFLKARLLALVDMKEATMMMSRLLEQLQESPDLDLLFEMLRFLIYQEEIPLFYPVFEMIEPLLEREEDFQDLLEIMIEYFSTLDREEEEQRVSAILAKRESMDKEREFMMQDHDFRELKKLVSMISL